MANTENNNPINPTPSDKDRLKLFQQTMGPEPTRVDKAIANTRARLSSKPQPYNLAESPKDIYKQKIGALQIKEQEKTATPEELELLNYHYQKEKESQTRKLTKAALYPDFNTRLFDAWDKDLPKGEAALTDIRKDAEFRKNFNIFGIKTYDDQNPLAVNTRINHLNVFNSEIKDRLSMFSDLYNMGGTYDALYALYDDTKKLVDKSKQSNFEYEGPSGYKLEVGNKALDLMLKTAQAVKANTARYNNVLNEQKTQGQKVINAISKDNFVNKRGKLDPTMLDGAFKAVSAVSGTEYDPSKAPQYGPGGEEDYITYQPIANSRKYEDLTIKYLQETPYTTESFFKDLAEGKKSKLAQAVGADMLANKPGTKLYSSGALEAWKKNPALQEYTTTGQEIRLEAEQLFKSAAYTAARDEFKEKQRELSNLMLYKDKLVTDHENANLAAQKLGRPLLPKLETPELDQQIEALNEELGEKSANIQDVLAYDPMKDLQKNSPELYKKIKLNEYETMIMNTPGFYNFNDKFGLSLKQAGKTIYDRWQDYNIADKIWGSDDPLKQAEAFLWNDTDKYNSYGYTIGVDEKGNPVQSSQFYWKDAKGNKHFNGLAIVESGLPVTEHMLETIALTELGVGVLGIGGEVVAGAAAFTRIPKLTSNLADLTATALKMKPQTLTEISSIANRTGKFITSPAIQSRLATLASVTATTYPSYYIEEFNKFKDPKDARDVAIMRSFVEGLSETVIPNTADLFTKGTKLFGLKPGYATQLADAFEGTARKLFPGASKRFIRGFADSRYGGKIIKAGRVVKEKAVDLLQEAVVEEEASLIGNYFVDKIAQQKDASYVMENELTWDNVIKTAAESAASMLITVPFLGGGTARRQNHNIAAARWNIASNPEAFKSFVTAQFNDKKITREEYGKRMANIDRIASELQNLPININSIRDLNSLLENKDLQLEYFSNHLEKQALLNYVPTEEERAEYDKALQTIDKKLYKTEKLAGAYDNLTVDQKKEIINKNLNNKYNELMKTENLSPAYLSYIVAKQQRELEQNPDIYSAEQTAYIEKLKDSYERVGDQFMDFIQTNNENLTFEQLDYKLNYLLQLNEQFIDPFVYEEAVKDLNRLMGLSLGPVMDIENEDDYVEALAKNFVTAKEREVPLVVDGKSFLREASDMYVNDRLFDRFVKDLPAEEQAPKLEELKQRLVNRMVELKQTLTPEQVFPEVPSVEQTRQEEAKKEAAKPQPSGSVQVIDKYADLFEKYQRAVEYENVEDIDNFQSVVASDLLKEENVEDLLTALIAIKPFFPKVNIDKIVEDLQNKETSSFENFLVSRGLAKSEAVKAVEKFIPKVEAAEVAEEGVPAEETKETEEVGETAEGAPIIAEEDNIVELKDEESESDVENDNRTKVLQEKEQLEFQKQDRPNKVYLGLTDTGFEENRLADPNTNFVYALVDRIENSLAEANLRSLDYYLLMKSDKDILAEVGINPKYKDDYASFRAQFIINDIPVFTEKQIEFYHKNFDKLGTFKIGVITDKNKAPLYFDKNGNKVSVGTPILVNIGQPGESEGKKLDKKFRESIPAEGQFVILSSFIPGVPAGRQQIKRSEVSKLRLILGQDETAVTSTGKIFTLYKGVVYFETGNESLPYVSTYTPKVTREVADNILSLVKAYNQMTKDPEASNLPEYFKEMSLEEFYTYLKTYVYIPDDSKDNDWGMVQVRRDGVRNHVKFYKRNESGKGNVGLSEDEIINLLMGNSSPKGASYAGIPKEYFNENKTFRPFTVQDGEIKVQRAVDYKNWFADRSTMDNYSGASLNRNLAFDKQDVETLPKAPAAPEAPVTTDAKISPYGIIAADYLFTGGPGVILSTDYFIQALSGAFTNAGGLIEQIRQKYINTVGDLGNLKDAIGTENYAKIIDEIRSAIESTYNNQEVNDIFNVVLNNATGFPSRLGNEISAKLERLNEQLATQQPSVSTDAKTDIEAKKADIERRRQEEPTIEPGRYVKYNNETYIVTKINPIGTIQIYNPLKTGVQAKKSVSKKNLTLLPDKGSIVTYREAEYIVTPKGTIVSLTTNKVMQWGPNDGNRIAIMELAKQPFVAAEPEIVSPLENVLAQTLNPPKLEETYVPQKGDKVSFNYYGTDYVGEFSSFSADGDYIISIPQTGMKEFIAKQIKNLAKIQTRQKRGDVDFEMPRLKAFGNYITPEQRKKAERWVNTVGKKAFGEDTYIFENTLTDPAAYAVWSPAAIRLFADANYADAYHESWHEFTQMYLTPEQREDLYKIGRKIYGEKLSDLEIEEKFAEDFRQFMLTDEIPEAIKKQKEARTIFQKIMDFLKNFFTNKKTADKYFRNLAKGKVGKKVGLPQFSNLYSAKRISLYEGNEKVSLSFAQTDDYMQMMDGLFIFVAQERARQLGVSYLTLLYNPTNIKKIYSAMYNYLVDVEDQAIYNNDVAAIAEINKIIGPEDKNFNRLSSFHNRYSDLFTKEMRVDTRDYEQEDEDSTPENPESPAEEDVQKDQMDSLENGKIFDNRSIAERSQEELAPPLVLNMVRALPEIENGEIVYNSITGAPLLGDFETNWNILKNTLERTPSYDEMRSKVEKLSKKYPQFKSLLEVLPKEIKDFSDQQVHNQFFNTFSMQRIHGILGKFNYKGKFSVNNTSSLDVKGIKDMWTVNFNSVKDDRYRILSPTTGNYKLNTEALFEDFPERPETGEEMLNFLSAIGFNYSQEAQKQFLEKEGKYKSPVFYIYNKLKSFSQSSKEEIFTPFAVVSARHEYKEDGVTKVFPGQSTNLNLLVQIEVDNNPAFANDMVMVADGTRQWMMNPPTYQSKVTDALNRYEYFEDLIAAHPELNPELNWGLKGSFVIFDYLFNFDSPQEIDGQIKHPRRTTENVPHKVDVVNMQGIKTDSYGFMNKKTIDLSDAEKHLADIRTLLDPYGRTEENNRIADKATTRGLQYSSEKMALFDPNTFIRTNASGEKVFAPKEEIWKTLLNYLKAEVEITNKQSYSERFNNHKFIDGVPQLAYFSQILDDELKLTVYNFLTENPDVDIQDFPYLKEFKTQFNGWMNELSKVSRREILTKLNKPEIKKEGTEVEEETDYDVDPFDLQRYHYISFIHRVEQFKLFNFHPYYYKNAKDVEKRIAGANATGNYPVTDQQNLAYTEAKLTGQTFFNKYADQKGIKVQLRRGDSKDFTYLVVKDTPVNSLTAQANKKDYADNYKFYVNSERKKNKLGQADRQDAASVTTLDFYKKFFSMTKGLPKDVSMEIDRQEKIWDNLLQVKLDPKNTEARETLNNLLNEGPHHIFSVKKLQYYGPGFSGAEVQPIFHKYSNKTVLPSEAVDNDELFNILVKLYASQADYLVFTSGTKISETVTPVDLYKEDGTIDSSSSPAAVADLSFLKEQQEVEHKEDIAIIFATQFRKLLFRDLTTDEEKELFDVYKKYVSALVEYDKGNFLKNIEDKELAVEFLINALSKKNIDALTLDLIKYDKGTGELQHTMDSILSRVVVESAMMSETRKKIIRQKFYGSQFVQFPVSLIRPNRKLQFYRKKDGKILPAEAIIAFSPKYYSLLQLPFDDNTTIGELKNGKPVNPYNALKRLNQKLQDPSFREENKDALTLAGLRIPGQGYNSMEHMEIVEFLPEESGDIILVPDELVVKSGGDFDIDKLFMYEPVLKDGKLLTEENSAKRKLEKLSGEKVKTRKDLEDIAELGKTTVEELKERYGYEEFEEIVDESKEDLLELYKKLAQSEERKILQNNLLSVIKERLSQPEIFNDLIEPNNINNIKEQAKNAPSYLTENIHKKTKLGNKQIWSNVVSPIYQLYVYQLAHIVDMVGIAAKANTFLTSAQDAKLELVRYENTSKVFLDVHRNKEGNIELWQIYDVDGKNKIGAIISETISGSVDVIKEDDILLINFTPETLPVALYLNNMGARFSDITKFLSDSLIYRYTKGESFEEIIFNMPEASDYIVISQYTGFSELGTAEKINKAIKKNEFLSDESNLGKIKRLANFILLNKQVSDFVTPVIRGVDYDTISPQNFESLRKGVDDLREILDKDIYNKEGLLKLIRNSAVSPFEIREDVLDVFGQLFPISSEKEVTDFIIGSYNAGKKAPKLKNFKKLPYETFSRRFKNELMTAIWQTNTPEANNYVEAMRIANPNNIVEMHKQLKYEANKAGIVVPLLDSITFTAETGSAFVAPGMNRNDKNYKVDVWKEKFNQNLNYVAPEGSTVPFGFEEDVRDFFTTLAYTGILSTQLNKTHSSFLSIIPEQFYTPKVDQKVKQFQKELKAKRAKTTLLNKKAAEELKNLGKKGEVTEAVKQEVIEKYRQEYRDWAEKNESNLLMKFFTRFKLNNPQWYNINDSYKPNPSLRSYKDYDLNKSTADFLVAFPPLISTGPVTKTAEEAAMAMVQGTQQFDISKKQEGPSPIIIGVPTMEKKPEMFASQTTEKEPITKSGYKVIIPEYPVVNLYLTKQNYNSTTEKMETLAGWVVETTFGFPIENVMFKTREEALNALPKIIEKKSIENRSALESIGFINTPSRVAGDIEIDRDVKDAIYKSGLESSEYEVVLVNGKQTMLITKFAPTTPTQPSTTLRPKGTEVKEGIFVNQDGLTQDEELELFNLIKPALENQAVRSNKGKFAPKMTGLNLNWDYVSNRLGKQTRVDVGKSLRPNNTYGWFTLSANGQKLYPITDRIIQLMSKATGIDVTNYDGAILNIYDQNSFIGTHPDIDESVTAKNYPVVVVNLGGSGNIVLGTDKDYVSVDLKSGSAYLFGFEGKNRTIPHSTYASSVKGTLPALTTKVDGETYEAGSYRVTVTMRRIMPLESGMPTSPAIVSDTPTRLKRGYSVFYGRFVDGKSLVKRLGKKIVVPGFEDINLMLDTDKNVTELSTGKAITTKLGTEKAIIEELKDIFETKNIREVLASALKINANLPGTVITPLSEITNQTLKEANIEQPIDTFLNDFAKASMSAKSDASKADKSIVDQVNNKPDSKSECNIG